MMMHEDEEYLNISEIAEELGIDPETVLADITSGRLKSREFDRVYYVTSSDIKAYYQRDKKHPGHRGR